MVNFEIILNNQCFSLAAGPGGYLRIVAPDMAEGDYVEIQCEGASPEDEGRIQWFFNNRVCTPKTIAECVCVITLFCNSLL